jgi:hypothetical protein
MPSPTSKAKLIAGIISFFHKSDRKRTPLETLPKVQVDSTLISWGLLSQPFESKASNGRGFWKRAHQMLILIFEWLMVLKWLYCLFMAEKHMNPVLIGDFVAYLPGKRIYYYLPLLFWTSIAATSATFFFMSRGKSELSWLKPFEVCKGKLKPEDIGLDSEGAAHFWQRVLITLWISKFMIRNIAFIALLVFTFIFGKLWPEEKLFPYGLVWALLSFIWVYYTIAIQFGVMAVFHQICYYLIVKFGKVNEIAKELESKENMDPKTSYEKINSFMLDHNLICDEVRRYNKFWQFNMAFNFIVYVVIICFIINLILFAKLILIIRILLLISIFAFFGLFCITTFSAGAVANEVLTYYLLIFRLYSRI